ncbi:flagellar basal body rod protein [Paraliobacillus sediminis]|uniref:lmo0954 family membrane protein n=1 Tax=Paraliobacillus sediminis TaxID=1885916 RepID=UPI000E3DDA09|nr:flagellar basal body rod protein [Paraliobacillus sediminis]
MKIFLLVVVGVIASLILLGTLGPMIFLAISLAIAYYGVRRFILSDSFIGKISWALIVLIGLSLSLSNTAAFVGLVAFIVLYYTYKSWKKTKRDEYDEDWILD